ncbi:hypothetical protein CC80DRAFT_529157 [Byssothecium circinans]|uniref:Uncharacterized protein n=1 Tax=Byssothecium circinans TaxID=147558 RepID=A0A6A5TDZ1_9PLEO|nr:hypothetical protein CC80DRAFT_529157 [Byssothecium circinans]
MSGIEIAGLVFGVVPVVVEILKSYSTAKRRLATFSQHAEVACDIQLRFQVAAANFNNDCRLLLQATIAHPSEVSEMMDDPTHKSWQEQGKDIEQRLRSLMCKIQKRRNIPSACIIRKAVPRSYQQIRVASQQLGESIHDSWSCVNTSHNGHQAKLSLDAKSGHDNVQLNVVVASDVLRGLNRFIRTIPLTTMCRPSADVPIWLHIQSITSLTTYRVPKSPPPALANALCHGIRDASHVQTQTSPSKAKSKKRVQINDPKDNVRCAQSFAMLDLKTIESVCCHVRRVRSSTKLAVNDVSSTTRRRGAMPIKSLVQRFRILQQITLAHKLAEAVLQYHSTSWLPQALHLSNRFPDHNSPNTEFKQELVVLKHTFGIRNLTLAKLGLDGIPYEIIEVRKLLNEQHHSIMTLGPHYLEVVRKCIYCDFSCDDDLQGEALQSAVYTEVVCALQNMKTRWEKFFGV